MPVIKDRHGNVINRSRTLQGISRYVSENKTLVQFVAIIKLEDGDGFLKIEFENGAVFASRWGTFPVLKMIVRQWRNLYGAPLSINGVPSGVVARDNPL